MPPLARFTVLRPRLEAAAPLLSLILTVLLLGAYPHPPALDWPQHTAVGGILAALWQGEPCVRAHYAFVWQPTPYHLLYVILAPAMGLLGGRAGAAATLMIMALWTHAGVAAWARALGRSHWAPVVSPLFFFSASFAWGFGPTMMGLGPALLALAGCTRLYARPNGPVACTTALWACLAVAAHGVYLPSMLLGALPLALMGGRSAWLCAALTVLGASVPVWPMVWAASPSGAPLALPEVTFETLSTGWNHLRLYFAAFDRGLCRAAHQLLTLGCAVVVVGRCRRFTAPERWVLLLALAHLSLLWLVPLNIALTPTPAWLLNVRFVTLFDVALCLLALPRHKTAAPMTLGAVSLCVALFLGGMARIFSQFHQAALYVDVLAETVPPNTCLPPVGAPLKFADAWPPLGRHLTSALVPHPVCAHGNVFVGGHFPLTPKLTCTHPEVYLGPP